MASPQQLTQATEEVFRDPEVVRTLNAWKEMHDRTGYWQAGRGISPEEVAFRRAVTATGKLPEGSHIVWEGQGADRHPVVRNIGIPGWAFPLIIGGIVVTAGIAGGAFGGAAGVAGAAGGGGGAGAAGTGAGAATTGGAAGVGTGAGAAAALEGGATAGLAGSGFGTGAGLGLTAVGAGSGAAAPILGSTAAGQSMSTLPAGSSILGDSTLAPDGGGGLSRFLNRDNVLAGANILGGALTAAQQNAREKELNQIRRDALQLDRDKYALGAPETRLDTSMHASRILNHEPVKAHWGGPGSGLRGETVRFTGGSANPNLIDPRTRDLSDDVLNQQLQDQLEHDDAINPNDPDAPVPARRRLPAPGSLPPSPDVAIPRRY